MTLQQTVTLGNDAQAVLDNEAYKQAISRMHDTIIKQWESSNPLDKEEQSLLLVTKKVAKLFEKQFYNMVLAGKDANHKIDLEAAREIPRGKVGRYLRTVSR